jgi:tRNA-splicing ligase RtcB
MRFSTHADRAGAAAFGGSRQSATLVSRHGASPEVLHALGIPLEWAERCEDAAHVGHDGTSDSLALRLEWVRANQFSNFLEKITQLGSYGGGNHFGECEVVRLLDIDRARRAGEVFGLRDGCVGFLSHCGSRDLDALLTDNSVR